MRCSQTPLRKGHRRGSPHGGCSRPPHKEPPKWVRRRLRIAEHHVVTGDGVPHSETFPDRVRAIHHVEEDTAMAAVESPASEHRLAEGDACRCHGDEAAYGLVISAGVRATHIGSRGGEAFDGTRGSGEGTWARTGYGATACRPGRGRRRRISAMASSISSGSGGGGARRCDLIIYSSSISLV